MEWMGGRLKGGNGNPAALDNWTGQLKEKTAMDF